MRRGRGRTPLRDTIVVALVIAVLGVVATLPRDALRAVAPVLIVSEAPESPCEAVAPSYHDACVAVARAMLAR